MDIPSDIRTWAEIDLDAIRHNLGVAREKIGPKPGIISIIKANAYGHGAMEVARALADLSEAFGVANLEEALPLLPLGRDILLLSPCLPGEREAAVKAGVIVTVSNASEAAACIGARLNFKVDTGMGRIGCPQEHALEELRRIAALPGVRLHSISTHLPVSDEDESYTEKELAEFEKLAGQFRQIFPAVKIHALNSAGVMTFPQYANDLVRAGLLLYGSAYPEKHQPLLQPALTWKTRIALVRKVEAGQSLSYGRTFIAPKAMRVASLAVGYADGFPRQASGQGAQVLIGGKRCDVLGRVTMDQILADVTDLPTAKEGDEVVLVGTQGGETILARELAAKASTISWDIFTGLRGRVHRFTHQAEPPVAPRPTSFATTKAPATATKEAPFLNSLGLAFVPIIGYKALFCTWPLRVQDYQIFCQESEMEMPVCDFTQGADHPVVNVTWTEAVAFCQWLTKRERELGVIKSPYAYRLPDDREWSAAVDLLHEHGKTPADRSGKMEGYPWGGAFPPPREAGNYHPSLSVDGYAETSPVGSFAPNSFGLYDMGGNVWEWCQDQYEQDTSLRVLRGASCFNDDDVYLRSSFRDKCAPDRRRNNNGVRLVLAAVQVNDPWF